MIPVVQERLLQRTTQFGHACKPLNLSTARRTVLLLDFEDNWIDVIASKAIKTDAPAAEPQIRADLPYTPTGSPHCAGKYLITASMSDAFTHGLFLLALLSYSHCFCPSKTFHCSITISKLDNIIIIPKCDNLAWDMARHALQQAFRLRHRHRNHPPHAFFTVRSPLAERYPRRYSLDKCQSSL